MGCCVSSSSDRSSLSASSPTRNKTYEAPRSAVKGSDNREPSPEEETVKEVLSETPNWTPSVAKFEADKPTTFQGGGAEKEKEVLLKKPFNFTNAEEISEVSEVCSLSESMSTTTIPEEETRQRVNRSPAKVSKNRSFPGERTVGRSPAKRSEQSPGRKNVGSVRIVQSRDQMGTGGTGNQPRRRDGGDNSGRRSRSPATRTDNGVARSVVGRSPSARRTNQSPGRVRREAAGNGGRKMEHSSMEGKWASSTNNESLENPLVSLECFIFL